MRHVAIMKKEWGLIEKILSGEKTIESRWLKNRSAPWNRVKPGDTIYFKNSGQSVTAKAQVARVQQYENYTDKELQKIINKYSGQGNIYFYSPAKDIYQWARTKKYCVLIWLSRARPVKPFKINKKGFGSAAAWLSVSDINSIKLD